MKIKYFLIIFILLFYLSQLTAFEKSVVIASTEYPPHTSIHYRNYGYRTDVVIQAFQEMGYQVEIRLYPWARALKFAKDGDVDGVIALHTKKREQWFEYSQGLATQSIGFYKHKKENISLKNYSDFKFYKIGYVRGYAIPSKLENLNLQITWLNKEEQALRMLSQKRLNLALMEKSVAQYIINKKYPKLDESIEWIEPSIEETIIYLAFSKKTKNYKRKLKDFNIGMARLKKLKKIKEIHEYHKK